MDDTITSVNPETEQWLIDRAVENTNGIYPEAAEWSPDQEQARRDLVGMLSDLHSGANISLSDIDGYLVAVIEAAERLRTLVSEDRTWDVGRNNNMTVRLGEDADYDTWEAFFARTVGWSLGITTNDGQKVDLLIAEVVHHLTDDDYAIVGYLWSDEEQCWLDGYESESVVGSPKVATKAILWRDIAAVTIN